MVDPLIITGKDIKDRVGILSCRLTGQQKNQIVTSCFLTRAVTRVKRVHSLNTRHQFLSYSDEIYYAFCK